MIKEVMTFEVAAWAVNRISRYGCLQYGRRIQDGLSLPLKPPSSYFRPSAAEISVGVSAMASVVPALQPHTLGLCLLILVNAHFRYVTQHQWENSSRSRAS